MCSMARNDAHKVAMTPQMTRSRWYTARHLDLYQDRTPPPLEERWCDGASGLLDSAAVRLNRWHGRLAPRWQTAYFESLKRDIAVAGGNVVPVLGRALREASIVELAYGSLRTQACRELGLPIFVVIRDMSEHELFPTMIREGAVDWSLFELGTSIVRALDGGLFPSRRKLAEACGLKVELVSVAAEAVGLPEFVIDAFGSPDKLTSSAVNQLARALEEDPDGVERRAKSLQGKLTTSTKGVLAALLSDSART